MRTRGKPGEAGYNMVILVIAVTVLNILLAIALPKWSYLIQRDKEEELRSRGLQYAEAIRVFQMRFGRLPVRLEELIKVKPRSIRHLYPDPMTDKGEWGIIFQQTGAPRPNPNDPNAPRNPGPAQGDTPQGTTFSLPSQVGGPATGGGTQVTIGPIVGVHSLSKETSLSSFFGSTTYDRWLFTADLLQRTSMGRPDAQAGIPRLDLRNLGRPFREGLDPMMNQGGS
jgi:type II secretory pathway pseudopilin PulG